MLVRATEGALGIIREERKVNENQDDAIRRLVDALQKTQSDVEPFLALHTPEAIVVNFGGRRVLGSDARTSRPLKENR